MGTNESIFACIEDDEVVNEECDDQESHGTSVDDEQLVWEFQRYQPNIGWAAGENFENSDPGRYASYNRKTFGDTLQSVAPEVPPGFKVDLNWRIVVQKRIKSKSLSEGGNIDETGITDKFGWHYSNSFFAAKW
jgi:hypothetical protein